MTQQDGFFFFTALLAVLILTSIIKKTSNTRVYLLTALILNAFVEYAVLVRDWIPGITVEQLGQVRLLVLSFCAATLLLSLLFTSQKKGSEKKSKSGSSKSSSDEPYKLRVVRGSGGDDSKTYLEKLRAKNKYRDELTKLATQQNTRLISKQFAQYMDSQDDLSGFRQSFHYPHLENSQPMTYLCGNSLGLEPVQVKTYVNEELDKWATAGVEGHFTGSRPWFDIEDFVVKMMSKVVGAKPVEVAVMNSLTANLHILLAAFYKPTPKRFKILFEENPFPSDMHAFVSHILTLHPDLNVEDAIIQIGPRSGEEIIRTEDILDIIEKEGDEIALVMFSGIHFMTGQFFEIEKITRKGHEKGCIVGFDLAHAAGNINLKLHDWGIDFGCWCSYKYLNSGPGNLSGIFVHERHANKGMNELPRFAGWWGHKRKTRFTLTNKFDPQEGAAGFQLSNPVILGMVAVQASLEVFDKAGIDNLRQKSFMLTSYLEMCLESELAKQIQILTPPDPIQRGCQISIRIPGKNLKDIMAKLLKQGVVCDEREPDVIRIAPTPLYNRYEDAYSFVFILKSILNQ